MSTVESLVTPDGFIPEQTVVYLDNKMSDPFVGVYASQRYVIQPGTRGIVPYFAMCLWFGDPRAVDIDEAHKFRHDEHDRLRVKYGAYEHDDQWEANKPNVEVFTLDGQRLITVVDDPEGSHLQVKGVNVAEQSAIKDAMVAMQTQIAQLQQQLALTNATTPNAASIDAIAVADDLADQLIPAPEGSHVGAGEQADTGKHVAPDSQPAPADPSSEAVVEDTPDIVTIKGG